MRHRCLHSEHYKCEEWKHLMITFIAYLHGISTFQQLNILFSSVDNSKFYSFEVVLFFYKGNTIHNPSHQFISCVYFVFVFQLPAQIKIDSSKILGIWLPMHVIIATDPSFRCHLTAKAYKGSVVLEEHAYLCSKGNYKQLFFYTHYEQCYPQTI